MVLPFDMTEYADRLQKVKASMAATGVDVLLVTNPSNINYLSGYDAWSFYVPQLLLVVAEEESPYWIGRSEDLHGVQLTTWLDDDHIHYYPDHYVQADTKHPMDFVSDLLRRWNLGNRHIGVDMDNYYFTARCYLILSQRLPDARFHDTTLLVSQVRMIKSKKEIGYMKTAAKLSEKAMRHGVDAVGPGIRECDVAADIYHAALSGTDDFGGDYPAIVPLMPSGRKTSAPHLTWSDQYYSEGDLAVIELAGCYKRYHAPLARTLKLGGVTAEERKLMDVVKEGMQTTLDFVKPGVTCQEVAEVWQQFIAKHGVTKPERLGYSVGLSYPPDWGEHTASIREGDTTVLQPNMTFHFIPGIWQKKGGVEVSETFAVTEHGCETLANFPRDLFSLDPGHGMPRQHLEP